MHGCQIMDNTFLRKGSDQITNKIMYNGIIGQMSLEEFFFWYT